MQKTMRSLAALLTGLGLLSSTACGSKKELDQTAETLRVAAEAGNYEAFKALAHPLLIGKFPPPELARLSKALETLGAFKQRSMHGFSVNAGGQRQGNYTLRYEKGSVELKVAVVAGKIVSFNFSGSDLQAALEAARVARYSRFEVRSFVFLDKPGGKDKRNNIFKVGEPIAFRMQVNGLKLVDQTIFFSADLKVTSDAETIFSRENFAGTDKPLATKGLPVGTLTGTIRLPNAPATYIAHFKVHDRHAKRSLAYEQAIVLQP